MRPCPRWRCPQRHTSHKRAGKSSPCHHTVTKRGVSARAQPPRTSGVAHMKRRLRTQCSSLAHPAHFDVVSLHDGSAGWRSAAAGRREAGEAGGERHALQLRRHSAHQAHATLIGSVIQRTVRALGGSPPSLMKPRFFVHSPCVTHVSHLMSSSAHVPLPALAASATSHQPHARWHVVALPSDQDQTRRQRQGATTAHKRRGAHEAAIAHAMLLLGPSRAFRRGVLA